MRKIGAVLFDYGMVLSGPPDPAAYRRMQTVLGADEDALLKAYWRARDAYDRGKLTGADYWRVVAGDLQRKPGPAELTALLEADADLWSQPNAPMIAWAGALQRDGVKTGILSNLGDAMEEALMRRLPWLAGFAHHTFSHRLGVAKPDAAIYAAAAAGLGVDPREILFLDDRHENIEGARAAGMVAVPYSDHARFVEELGANELGSLLHLLPNSEP